MERSHLFLAPSGWGDALGDELSHVFLAGAPARRTARWWELRCADVDVDRPVLVFAQQSLPDSVTLDAASVRKAAAAIALFLRETAAGTTHLWRLQVFAPLEDQTATRGRAKLLGTAIRESLKRKAKGLLSLLDESGGRTPDGTCLAQVSWLAPEQVVTSWCDAQTRSVWRGAISPWPGGVAPVPTDRRPPSRAYRKLHEALAHMGRGIEKGQTVVDLGASPGGWSFVALENGAHVTAVDRAPLREDLMRSPRLNFVNGDAFRYELQRPVDWMIADVAAFPERTFELIERWLANGWTRALVATVKFVGAERYAILEDFKAMLTRVADRFLIRKLLENKNEATVMAWKDSRASMAGRTQAAATEA